MSNITIIFGTDTGYTRKTAKLIAKKLGKNIVPNKPVNINRITLEDFLSNELLILGTPTYGEGVVPGIDTGVKEGSWAEFIPKLPANAMKGKTVALFGFGDQKKYSEHFVNGLGELYDALVTRGAKVVGQWPLVGYEFEASNAARDGKFVGLVLDDKNQSLLTDDRVNEWLEQITHEFGL